MAGIDHSIYFQQRPVDFLGGISQGMQMRGQMDQRAAQQAEQQRLQLQREQQAEAQKAFSKGIVRGADGSTSMNLNQAIAGLGEISPTNPYAAEQMINLEKTMYGRNQDAQRLAAEQEQRLWDRDYKDRALQSSAADRAEARNERRYQSGILRDEKIQALQTPYGMANTVDDAKQLKDAHLAKQGFDSKLDEMIALREKNNGGALFNREDVARGQQLSKDLLLEYKNMAKLGVLSKSDEDIINAIIPEDPLEYNSPLAAIQGQDPTLARLKAFKSDSDKNFKEGIATRTRAGLSGRVSELNMPPRATKQDSEAVQWAKQNPNDPRSSAILKANGFGG